MTNQSNESRPRERLLALGPQGLNDAELLALFIGTGYRGVPVLPLAQRLLQDHDGLSGLLQRTPQELLACAGLGPASVTRLLAAIELAERYLHRELSRSDVLNSPERVVSYLRHRYAGVEREVFSVLFLDTQHRVLGSEALFLGTIDSASVHPREVVKAALRQNASAVILAHNHPSGVAEPSQADRRITTRLEEALRTVEVRVLDHIVLGAGVSFSFAERGLLG